MFFPVQPRGSTGFFVYSPEKAPPEPCIEREAQKGIISRFLFKPRISPENALKTQVVKIANFCDQSPTSIDYLLFIDNVSIERHSNGKDRFTEIEASDSGLERVLRRNGHRILYAE